MSNPEHLKIFKRRGKQSRSCFIRFSTLDQDVAAQVCVDLQAKGILCWFEPNNTTERRELREPTDEAIHLDFSAVEQLPENVRDVQVLRRTLDDRLSQEFYANLSAREQQIFDNGGLNSLTIRRLWDEFLYDAVAGYGSLIFLSDKALHRVHAWWLGVGEPAAGLQKLKRFLKAVQHSAEVRRGTRKAKITRQHARYKLRAIPELKILKQRLFDAFPNDLSGIIDFIRNSLSTPEFSSLRLNTASLLRFLENSPLDALGFRGLAFEEQGKVPDLSPARFLDRWVAWSTGRRSPEAVRQKMSNPDDARRKPRK